MPTTLPVADSFARLRDHQSALRGAGWAARRDLLCAWARTWEEPELHHPQLLATLVAASGLSHAALCWALRTTLGELTADAADAWIAGALGARFTPEDLDGEALCPVPLVGHVWASTLPTSGWLPVVGCLLLGATVYIKAPERTWPAAEALTRSLAEALRPLGEPFLAAGSWGRGDASDEALAAHADALVVSGGRDAIQRFSVLAAEREPAPIPCVGFGPGYSAAVVPADALDPATFHALAAALALDVAAYDQQGCLSPQALWIEDHPLARPLADEIALALSVLASTMPRGIVPDAAAAAILQRRSTAAFRGVVLDATDATVLWEPHPYRVDNPLWRTLPVHLYRGGPEGLTAAIDALPRPVRRLHALAVAGSPDTRRRYAPVARRFHASRLCPPGTMQTPPLAWHHDGMSWLNRLLHVVDVE